MANDELQLHLFTGRWIGETQGYRMPAHIWEIKQHRSGLTVSTRWEDSTHASTFLARLVADPPSFTISGSRIFRAVLVDKQHFVVAGWCTNDARGGVGPDYDVVFSRPGIAELNARQAYADYLGKIARAEN
jgi:hypothetical protein